MEPVIYLLAILGCGDDRARCEQLRVEPAHYASVASCRAAMAGALMRNSDAPYPVVVTECRKSTQVAVVKNTEQLASR